MATENSASKTEPQAASPSPVIWDDATAGDPLLAFDSEENVVEAPVIRSEPAIPSRTLSWPRPPAWSELAARVRKHAPAWEAPSRTDRWIMVAAIALLFGTVVGGLLLSPPRPQTGWVMITSEPPGATVSIDGELRAPSPFGTSLSVGKHRIEAGSGPTVRSQTIDVSPAGDTSVHIELLPKPDPTAATGTGGLQISTQPARAQVWVDGKPRGAAPLTVMGLAAGPHDVTVRGADGSMHRRVTVRKGSVSSLIISITSVDGFQSGWLTISSPVSAEIREGGLLLGTTDTPRLPIPAGEHHLEVINPAFGYRVERTIRITAGQSMSIVLEVPHGTLHVNAQPWAEVWVDGSRLGDTPIENISMPIGQHEVVFRHPELGERKRTVAVGLGGPTRVGVDFRN